MRADREERQQAPRERRYLVYIIRFTNFHSSPGAAPARYRASWEERDEPRPKPAVVVSSTTAPGR